MPTDLHALLAQIVSGNAAAAERVRHPLRPTVRPRWVECKWCRGWGTVPPVDGLDCRECDAAGGHEVEGE